MPGKQRDVFPSHTGIFCAQSLGQNFDLVTANPPCAAHRRDREGWKWLLRVSQWEVKKEDIQKTCNFQAKMSFVSFFESLMAFLMRFV